MLRNSISFITALYAIGFAFIALTAVRWPSLLMLAAFFSDDAGALNQVQGLFDWREMGLTYGAIYLFAALFFYTSSTLIGRAGRGSVVCYVLGAGLGFTPMFLFDFDAGWWQNPDTFEQGVMFAGAMTFILFGAVWDLSRTKTPQKTAAAVSVTEPEILLDRVVVPVALAARSNTQPMAKHVRRKPVPAAIARQRASFAAYGRRARAKQLR